MLLNYAKFAGNGGVTSGYKLKPKFMWGEVKAPVYPRDILKHKLQVDVEIISGQ